MVSKLRIIWKQTVYLCSLGREDLLLDVGGGPGKGGRERERVDMYLYIYISVYYVSTCLFATRTYSCICICTGEMIDASAWGDFTKVFLLLLFVGRRRRHLLPPPLPLLHHIQFGRSGLSIAT